MLAGIDRRGVLVGAGGLALLSAGSALAAATRPVPPKRLDCRDLTADDATEGWDLSGKLALVTGCNSGIGFETMRVLAKRGAHVLGAARTLEKATKACAQVSGETTPLLIELTDFPSIDSAAGQVGKLGRPLDMLICNAGVMSPPQRTLSHGVELQFAVNHLGHFVLVERLLDQVTAAADGRIVVLSSELHRGAPPQGIKFDDLAWDAGDYDGFVAYAHSKLANVLFTRELSRRLESTNASANAVHPGVIKTNLVRHMPESVQAGDWDDRNVAQGATTSCYVAGDPSLRGVSGYYFTDCNAVQPSELALDDEAAARLWAISEQLVAATST
jgi:NAD(P)-dependent dehydrogenase (short-subunit alcohol dehydrogenase family)